VDRNAEKVDSTLARTKPARNISEGEKTRICGTRIQVSHGSNALYQGTTSVGP
jgi:hypothetical protein